MCTRARCLRRHHRKPARKKKENATETQHYAIQSEWALVRTHTPFVITAVRRPGRLGEGAAGVRLYRWKRIASLLLPAQTARNYKLFPRREEKCLSSSFLMFYNTEALMSASQLGFHYIEFFFLFLFFIVWLEKHFPSCSRLPRSHRFRARLLLLSWWLLFVSLRFPPFSLLYMALMTLLSSPGSIYILVCINTRSGQLSNNAAAIYARGILFEGSKWW